MNGGTITGNTVKSYGLIGMEAQGRNSAVELNGGKIVDNTWLDADMNAVRMIADYSFGAIYLGGNTVIEGKIGGNSSGYAPKLTGTLSSPVTIGGFDLSANTKRDESNNPIWGCYGSAVVTGAEGYTLTVDDLNNVSWADESLVLYFDPSANGVYAMDTGIEKKYDSWIIKGEVVTHTVTFYDGDGSVLDIQKVITGESATAPSVEPSKASTAEHSYTVSHWDKDFSYISSNLDIYPIFTEGDPLPTFTVTFYDGDNTTVLKTQVVDEGKSATAPIAVPTKADEGIYRYTFSNWDKDFSNITENLDVYPVFTQSEITYNIKFIDSNKSVLKEETITKGEKTEAPEYTAPTGYIFKGWAVSGITTVIDFKVYVPDGDTTIAPVLEYKVIFNNDQGEQIAEVESVGGLITPPEAPEDGGYNDKLPLMIEWIKDNMTNPDAKFAWHMLWANEQIHSNGSISDQQSFGSQFDCDEGIMYKGIVDAVQTKIVPNENFDYIIPSGTLMQNLRNTYFGNFVTGDSIHSHHQYGSYPISMLWGEVLLGIDADTINYIPELDEYQSVQSVQYVDEKFLATAHNAINKTLDNPYEVTIDGPQEVFPVMSVDFGEPTQDGDNYKYTATVYLEQYGNIHGVGAVDNGSTVTDTGNYVGLKIKDWSLDVSFENSADLVSVGTADSYLKVVGGYEGGEATYIAPDMTASANGGKVKVTSATGGDAKKAYPYYGLIKSFKEGKLALGTFEVITTTDSFNVNMSASLQYGNTYTDGSFIEDASKTTYVTDNAGDKATLIMNTEIIVGQPEIADDPADGLITSEAELREALGGNLSTSKNNPTRIVLGADIILDDGNATPDDLTDGTFIIGSENSAKVYVDISGDYTIKNMQNLNGVYLFNITNAVVNITDTVIDVNYGNDSRYGEPDKAYNLSAIKAITSDVALNGTATIKNGYGSYAVFAGKWADTATFTMNDNSKITGWRLNKSKYDTAILYVEGYGDSKFVMNGGEISGNVLGMTGILHIDDNHRPQVILNAGNVKNNDTSKARYLFSFNNSASGSINPSGMIFDEETVRLKTNGGSAVNVTGSLTSGLQRYSLGTTYQIDGGTVACFKGANGYLLTPDDLQKMSTGGMNPGRHPTSRVLALDTAKNTVYSYVTIDDVPKGAILADGTIVGEVVINDSITDVTEANGSLTVSYQTNPKKTVTGTPIAAIYKGSNLIDTTYDKAENVSLSGNNNTGTIKLDAPSDWATNRGDYRIKFFIWNPLTLAPQIDVLQYEAK